MTLLGLLLLGLALVGWLWSRAKRVEEKEALDLDYESRRILNEKLAAIARRRVQEFGK